VWITSSPSCNKDTDFIYLHEILIISVSANVKNRKSNFNINILYSNNYDLLLIPNVQGRLTPHSPVLVSLMEKELLTLRDHLKSFPGFMLPNLKSEVFCVMFCGLLCVFVVVVLFLPFWPSDYSFDIFKLLCLSYIDVVDFILWRKPEYPEKTNVFPLA
jgi:hypothetical protein